MLFQCAGTVDYILYWLEFCCRCAGFCCGSSLLVPLCLINSSLFAATIFQKNLEPLFQFWKKNVLALFFVFQSCELRFSGEICLFLIRSFPGSFVFRHLLESTHHTIRMSLYAIMWVQIWSRAIIITSFFLINTHVEKPISFCSNSLVFQNYVLRFWRDFYLILIRSFPGSFGVQAHPGRWYTAPLRFFWKIYHMFFDGLKRMVMYPSYDGAKYKRPLKWTI